MMKRVLGWMLVVVLLAGATGCVAYQTPVMPPVGWAYAKIKAPLDVDFNNTSLGSKVGRAQVTNVLGMVTTGDCSTQAAVQAAGGMTTIRHADYEYFNVLGVYQTFTVILYGD